MGDAHALAAAAGAGLDHYGIADLIGDDGGVLRTLDHAEEAGHGRDFRRIGEFLRLDLVAHRLDGVRVRPDEHDASRLQRLRESGAFRQKTIAGMDRLSAGLAAGCDDLIDDQIGLGRRRGADGDGFVGHLDMQRIRVGLGIDSHGLDPEPSRGLHHPAGDFAAVGDQDLVEHAAPPAGGFPGWRGSYARRRSA